MDQDMIRLLDMIWDHVGLQVNVELALGVAANATREHNAVFA
jgi:hypothetical protein